jgi:hypothetical protein
VTDPYANLTQAAIGHAGVLIGTVSARGLGKSACAIVLMTAITESHIRVLANPGIPASETYPNDGDGHDHASVGIFQQQPWWGPLATLMDPAGSCNLFLGDGVQTGLLNFDWQSLTPWAAAQRVQGSASPDGSNYKANYAQAVALTNALWSAHSVDSNPPTPLPIGDEVTPDDIAAITASVTPAVTAAVIAALVPALTSSVHDSNVTIMRSDEFAAKIESQVELALRIQLSPGREVYGRVTKLVTDALAAQATPAATPAVVTPLSAQ